MAQLRLLHATCSSGFCNRILLLVGCERVAEKTGRDLVFYWPLNEQFACPFASLFQNQVRLFGEPDLHTLLRTDHTVKVYNAWRSESTLFTRMAADGDPEFDIVVVKGWHFPLLTTDAWGEGLFAEIGVRLRQLVPVPEVQRAVDAFPLSPSTIGVHIRRGDALEVFGQSSDQHFATLMRAMVERRPNLQFFLATDDPQTEQKFLTMFAGRTTVFAKHGQGRHDIQGGQEALIDLLLLSRCHALIGNINSSYSQTAGSMGNQPVFLPTEENCGPKLDETCRLIEEQLAAAAPPQSRPPE